MNYRKCKISLKRHWKAQEPLRSYNPKMVSPFCPITPKTDSVKNRSLALSRVLLGQPHTRFWVCWKERREGEKGDGREGIDIPAKTMSSPHTRVLWTKHLLSLSYIQSYWISPCKGSRWAHCPHGLLIHTCVNITLGLHTKSYEHGPTFQSSTWICIRSLLRRMALGYFIRTLELSEVGESRQPWNEPERLCVKACPLISANG